MKASLLIEKHDLLDWAQEQEWCEPMKNCQQDPKWHSEGDVWTHTLKVIEELTNLEAWQELSKIEQSILLWAALLHDVGKPSCTIIENETIKSPKHSIVGAKIAFTILSELEIEFPYRQKIISLIRFHTTAPNIIKKKNGKKKKIIELSWLLNNYSLYLLAKADGLGREGEGKKDFFERVELFQMLAEENKCLMNKYKFKNTHSRFQYFFDENKKDPDYEAYESFKSSVIMLSGLPGAGKDTWIKKYGNNRAVISLDDLRKEMKILPTSKENGKVIQEAQKGVKLLLANKTDFIFNATNISKSMRAKWIRIFNDYGAKIEIVYIEPSPIEKIYIQNASRKSSVPNDVIKKLFHKLEIPNLTEAHEVKYWIGNSYVEL